MSFARRPTANRSLQLGFNHNKLSVQHYEIQSEEEEIMQRSELVTVVPLGTHFTRDNYGHIRYEMLACRSVCAKLLDKRITKILSKSTQKLSDSRGGNSTQFEFRT
mmetsp:Transcript_3811/g.8217  ORF Transcript_3811/g.8217 Transcript_3811/m.8217 type:complete len:106 (+) Transcript_3811:273-590(+)